MAFISCRFSLREITRKGERCFVAGIEDCVKENRVFREWARAWAKRVIVGKAIRELHPRRNHSNSSTVLPTVFSRNQQPSGPIGHFDLCAVSGLADSSGLFSCFAFWSATGSTSVLWFSAARLPKFAKLALRLSRSWLSPTQVVPTGMKIVSPVGGQKRSRRERRSK
jgi:hypothetical protein